MGIASRLSSVAAIGVLATAIGLSASFNASAQGITTPEPTADTITHPATPDSIPAASDYDMAALQALIASDPATITDRAVLNDNFFNILRNIDIYFTSAQTYQNAAQGFDVTQSPFVQDSVSRLHDYLEAGANPDHIDAATGASAFAWAIWIAYELDKPDLVQDFITNGADIHKRSAYSAQLPQSQMNGYKLAFGERPDTGNHEVSLIDHAVLAMLEADAINTGVFTTSSSLEHLRSAARITAMLIKHGAAWEDITQLPSSITTSHGVIELDFSSLDSLITTPSNARILFEEGLISAEQHRTAIYGTTAMRDTARALTEITPQILQDIEAPLVDYPDAAPGGPEPYTVQINDTVWDIAGRFSSFMGDAITSHEQAFWAMADLNNMTVLPRNQVMRINPDGTTTIGITTGETLLIPVNPILQLGHSSAPIAAPIIMNMIIDYAIDQANLQPSEYDTLLPKFIEDIKTLNGITSDEETLTTLVAGQNILLPSIKDTDLTPVTFTREDVLRRYAANLQNNFYIENPSIDQVFNALAQLNGIDNIEFCNPVTLAQGESCPMLWVPFQNDTYSHFEPLIPPEDYDPERRVDLFITETEGYHQKMATRAATGTGFALNPSVDMTQFHVLADPVWGAHVTTTSRYEGSEALKILQHPDNPLRDDIVFSSSMALGVIAPPQGLSSQQAAHIRNDRGPDHSAIENIRATLERLEKASPIIFQAIGNSYPYDLGWAFGASDIHSGRTVMVGAIGHYDTNTGEVRTIAPYSSPYADICAMLPQDLGHQNEGTSFSTPNTSAIYRQMSRWYGDRLSFEEILAAGMMTASRNTSELVRTPFGNFSPAAKYRTNGGGLPFNDRCGAGEIDPHVWNETLKEMVTMKEALDNPGERYTRIIDIDEAAAIETLDNGDTLYTYRIEMPADLTLGRLTFLLPQYAGAHSEVMVRTPSGFEYLLPKSLTDVVSSSAFSFEDVKKGDILEIITGEPLADTALMVLRAHTDGNVIQSLRDTLQNRGIMHQPHMLITGDNITEDQGITPDLSPALPARPKPQ